MKITDIFKNKEVTLSFEVFPPKTDAGYAAVEQAAAEIAALKSLQDHDNDGGESAQTTIKKLEQRNQDLNRDLHGQKTEGKYNRRNNMTPADEADLNGEDVPESTFNVSDDEFSEIMDGINVLRNNKPSVKSNGRKPGLKVPQRPQPLKATAREITIEPDFIPEGAVLSGQGPKALHG